MARNFIDNMDHNFVVGRVPHKARSVSNWPKLPEKKESYCSKPISYIGEYKVKQKNDK